MLNAQSQVFLNKQQQQKQGKQQTQNQSQFESLQPVPNSHLNQSLLQQLNQLKSMPYKIDRSSMAFYLDKQVQNRSENTENKLFSLAPLQQTIGPQSVAQRGLTGPTQKLLTASNLNAPLRTAQLSLPGDIGSQLGNHQHGGELPEYEQQIQSQLQNFGSNYKSIRYLQALNKNIQSGNHQQHQHQHQNNNNNNNAQSQNFAESATQGQTMQVLHNNQALRQNYQGAVKKPFMPLFCNQFKLKQKKMLKKISARQRRENRPHQTPLEIIPHNINKSASGFNPELKISRPVFYNRTIQQQQQCDIFCQSNGTEGGVISNSSNAQMLTMGASLATSQANVPGMHVLTQDGTEPPQQHSRLLFSIRVPPPKVISYELQSHRNSLEKIPDFEEPSAERIFKSSEGSPEHKLTLADAAACTNFNCKVTERVQSSFAKTVQPDTFQTLRAKQGDSGGNSTASSKAKIIIAVRRPLPLTQIFFYQICEGNNGDLVKRVIKTRSRLWQEAHGQPANFRWQQSSFGYDFSLNRQFQNIESERIFNHFEFHNEISDKSLLLTNLLEYGKRNGVNVAGFLPLTVFEKQLKQFLRHFFLFQSAVESKHSEATLQLKFNKELKEKARKYYTEQKLGEIACSNLLTSQQDNLFADTGSGLQASNSSATATSLTQSQANDPFSSVPDSFYGAFQNMWLFKPSIRNRGRGIETFNELTDMISYLKENRNTVMQKQEEIKTEKGGYNQYPPEKRKFILSRVLETKFILQKYLENPLLIQNRKFDLRIWVLVNNSTSVLGHYVFKEGYARMSSYEYDISDVKNKFIHLTNNAVQKFAESYNRFEEGNQLSYEQIRQQFEIQGLKHFQFDEVLEKIKEIIRHTLRAVKGKLNKERRRGCFEIFGYDFMIDSQLRPYLIEINTNPCIEESSPILKILLPRMIDDTFRLTIDKIFAGQVGHSVYEVEGYRAIENLWEPLYIR